MLPRPLHRLAVDDKGANFVEYMIILGVVALVGIGALATFGTSVTGKIAEQGERLSAMQGSVRSLDVRSRPSTAGAAAQSENLHAARSGEAWESAAEAQAPSPAVGPSDTGRDGEIGRAGAITTGADKAVGFDSVAVAITVLFLVGVYLVYRLAPGARWMSLVRSHVAGRLPWTPRE